MLHQLNVDIETYSSVEIKTGGLYKYAQAPDFTLLLFGYALDDGPPQVVDLAGGGQLPPGILAHLQSPQTVKHAYNAAFEWQCLSRWLGLSETASLAWLAQWRDTMLHALYCGYPAALDAAGEALGLAEDKRKLAAGRALVRTFCTPRKPTARDPRTRVRPADEPEKWQLFKEYNARDVVAEREIGRLLAPFPVPEALWRQWRTDLAVNRRGVAVDRELVEGALECSGQATRQLTGEAAALTGLANPNSVAQLSAWLEDQTGAPVRDLRKDTVAALLEGPLPDPVRRALELRQELGKTSNKKYTAMQAAACADGRVRGLLQFYGANRTGRWAGRLVQVQNLPRTHLAGIDLARRLVRRQKADTLTLLYGSVPDTLSQLIRTAFVPAPGHVFVDADFSAIEARVLAWLAGEEWVLEVFRTHGRIYEATASQMFGVPVERIVKGSPEYELRQKGKVATLALGYQGGPGALTAMGALRMGIPEEELPGIRDRWRQANRRIVAFWYAVEQAAVEAVRTGQPQQARGLAFRLAGTGQGGQLFLTIRLPGGRDLFYARPRLIADEYGRERLHYQGVAQGSRQWQTLETYGGKLAENITQAVARDCLAEAIERLEDAGWPVVFHIHDEVVIECPREKADLEEVCRIMGRPPVWAPDLPLRAEGWVGDYFTKD